MASAGYIFVSLESLKLQQQADLFRCASDIVAPPGAALAFLALCPEKTNVLELVPAGNPNPCFYRLSRIRRLQHTVLFSGSKDRPPVWDLNPNNSDWPSESQIVDFL
jgi:capsular polysaccharide biosynthesis protein